MCAAGWSDIISFSPKFYLFYFTKAKVKKKLTLDSQVNEWPVTNNVSNIGSTTYLENSRDPTFC